MFSANEADSVTSKIRALSEIINALNESRVKGDFPRSPIRNAACTLGFGLKESITATFNELVRFLAIHGPGATPEQMITIRMHLGSRFHYVERLFPGATPTVLVDDLLEKPTNPTTNRFGDI